MNYLSSFIGRVITVNLTDDARKDKMMILFYETDRYKDSFIGNKLLGLDANGIWLEGFQKLKRFKDKSGNDIPVEDQKTVDATVSVFIPFNYISGIAIVQDPELNQKGIGFNTKAP